MLNQSSRLAEKPNDSVQSKRSAEKPNLNRPIVVIPARAFREGDAAAYLGLSASYLRNLRVADGRRLKAGDPIQGPRWINIGQRAIRYLREDLDAWLDAHRRDPAMGDPA